MEDGTASRTARHVAAHRLDYERIATPYGDPDADLALAADIADGMQPARNRMHDYLRARTAFFDRVVVDAIDQGIGQVVVGAAGYDGRAFRYARPGVRWFEVDHPATQADKLARVARLGIDAGHVRYVAADFATDPVAGLLTDAGLDPGSPALFLLEGVAVYLDREVIERVLRQFRAVTTAGSPLAISVSLQSRSEARDRFLARVAAMGEPARSALAPDEALALLASQGWQVEQARSRLSTAGLLLARAGNSSPYPERSGAAPRAKTVSVKVTTPPREDPLPLPALLSQALVAFTIECDNEAEHRIPHRTAADGRSPGAPAGAPWLTSLVMWANCLRFLPDEGITVRELRRLARTDTNLDGMRRWGYVKFAPDPGPGKRPRDSTVMRPTERGRHARDTWQGIDAVIERRWQDRLGAAAAGALRSALAGVRASLDPALPDCLPILGYGLFSRTISAGPAAIAQDSIPLWALMSKPLLAFAAEFERESDLSLAISANVVRVLNQDGVRTRDVPVLAGVSKESVAIAMGVLRKQALAGEAQNPSGARGNVIRLTAEGAAAQRNYRHLVAALEDRWRDRLGADRVAALRSALEPLTEGDPPPLFAGLEPYPDNWRAQVRRPAVLPHYPMVLHRGGYPDGS